MRQDGFTMLELLVSVSIITLLVGTGIPAFRHFGAVSQLDQAADQVKGAILDTRAYALGPRSQRLVTANDWYEIDVNQNTATYTIYEGVPATGTAVTTATLPPFIQIPAASSPIAFSISKQAAVGTSVAGTPATFALATSDPSITLTNSQLGPSESRIITVNRQTGAVSITR